MFKQIRARAGMLALRTAVRAQSLVSRLRTDEKGQTEWVNQLMILGVIVLVAGLIFAFWKAGGTTWINGHLNDLTQY